MNHPLARNLAANNDGDALDSGDTDYGYDSAGVRVSQLTHNPTNQATVFLNDPANPTGYSHTLETKTGVSLSAAAASTPQIAYALGIRAEGQVDSAGVVWFLRDGHGSNRGLADGNGVVTAGYEYSGFGEALNFTAATARTVELFGGDGVYEAKTGWTYHLARWRSGFRFTSMDSYAGEAHGDRRRELSAQAEPQGEGRRRGQGGS